MNYRLLPLGLCLLLAAACSNQAVYDDESFSDDSPFRTKVAGDAGEVCESARRSLLGQGYLIESATPEEIKARKAARGGDSQNTFIEMNIVCLPEHAGATLFATGLLSEYALKKNSSSASVGVSALGSISLPIGQSADSLVKVSEETIDDKHFYQRFFGAVSTTLAEMQVGKQGIEVEVEAEPVTLPAAEREVAPPEPSSIEDAAMAAPEAEEFNAEIPTGDEPPLLQEESESVYTLKPMPAQEAVEAAPMDAPEPASDDELQEMTIEEIMEQAPENTPESPIDPMDELF